LEEVPGLLAYYVLDAQDGAFATVTICESQEALEECAKRAAAFGYYVVLPVGMEFLLSYGTDRYEQIITADSYLKFVTRFLLAFGIVFELPAATYVGAKLGLVNAPLLRRYRRHAIVVNAVIAAALTPGQDPFSMILMAIPMVLMYELSILIARFVNPPFPQEEPLPDSTFLEHEEERDL
jgi:sec-independent protein translocase protein TatC